MTVLLLNQTVLVEGVTNIMVTEAVDDGEGGFVREIRVFGPIDAGIDPIHTVRIRGTSMEAIKLTTPSLEF